MSVSYIEDSLATQYMPRHMLSQPTGAYVAQPADQERELHLAGVSPQAWNTSFWLTNEILRRVTMLAFKQAETSIVLQAMGMVDALLNDLRRQNVAIPRETEVRLYLQAHPGLLDIVREAVTAVRKRIADGYLVLDVYSDPEIHDQYLELVVRVPVYDERLIDRIEEAEAGYIHKLGSSTGWLQLTTDFQPPEMENAF
jgi:hypothetical protein